MTHKTANTSAVLFNELVLCIFNWVFEDFYYKNTSLANKPKNYYDVLFMF